MNTDDPSRMSDGTVFGRGGACATSQPAAVDAGMEVLARGGTAVDAAVAMAAALTVVEPTSNGIGADAFALVWAEGKLFGLNGSGRAPSGMSLEALRAAGHDGIPERGWWTVTVPGAPAAWRDLQQRFGRLEFAQVLAPAVALARDGFVVTPVVAKYWSRAHEVFCGLEGPEFAAWRDVFAPRGRAPAAGEKTVLSDHARTLERIGSSRAAEFYEGDLAHEIDAFAQRTGGLLRAHDLATHASDWVEPIHARYRDAELWELPPNGQGISALAALGILDGLPAGETWDDPEGVHFAIEAVKLTMADAAAHVTDPEHMSVDARSMLDEEYVAGRRRAIGPRAEVRTTGLERRGGTVYLTAADKDGMMVSYIQSNYMGFGSGVVVPGTGIALQNRGAGFSAVSGHPNCLAPGKRPFHTIIPAFLTQNGEPWGPMGVMGGFMQPQGHVQVMRDLMDFGMAPQQALDLPRWRWQDGVRVVVEPGWPRALVESLRSRGHEVAVAPDEAEFGRGQMILHEGGGVLAAASDRRADGKAVAVERLPE